MEPGTEKEDFVQGSTLPAKEEKTRNVGPGCDRIAN